MKPHIYKAGGIWFCKQNGTSTGLGDNPEDAYLDWEYWNIWFVN